MRYQGRFTILNKFTTLGKDVDKEGSDNEGSDVWGKGI